MRKYFLQTHAIVLFSFAATNETTLSGKAPFFLSPPVCVCVSSAPLTGTILSRPSFQVPSEVKVKYKAKDATVYAWL